MKKGRNRIIVKYAYILMRINIAEIGLQRTFCLYATEISTQNPGTN